jgi:excisionase family DNA binding protein
MKTRLPRPAPIAAASPSGAARRISCAGLPAARATPLELRLAAALSPLITVLEPVIIRLLIAALAAAGGPGPLAGAGGRGSGPAAYTIDEAAARARLSRTATYTAVRTGRLKVHKHGARSLILPDDLAAFLAALPVFETSRPAERKIDSASSGGDPVEEAGGSRGGDPSEGSHGAPVDDHDGGDDRRADAVVRHAGDGDRAGGLGEDGLGGRVAQRRAGQIPAHRRVGNNTSPELSPVLKRRRRVK